MQVWADCFGTLHVENDCEDMSVTGFLDLIGGGGDADLSVRSLFERFQRGELLGYFALRIDGIEGFGESDFVARVRYCQIVFRWVLGWRAQGEESAKHSALFCAWEIEMADG